MCKKKQINWLKRTVNCCHLLILLLAEKQRSCITKVRNDRRTSYYSYSNNTRMCDWRNGYQQLQNKSVSFLDNHVPSPLAARCHHKFQTSFWYLPWTKLYSKRRPYDNVRSNRAGSLVGTVLGRQWRAQIPGTASCAPAAKRRSVLLPSLQAWHDHWFPRVYVGQQTFISVDTRQHIWLPRINIASHQDIRFLRLKCLDCCLLNYDKMFPWKQHRRFSPSHTLQNYLSVFALVISLDHVLSLTF